MHHSIQHVALRRPLEVHSMKVKGMAMITRTLRQGKTFDDYRKAWYHNNSFGLPTQMLTDRAMPVLQEFWSVCYWAAAVLKAKTLPSQSTENMTPSSFIG